MADHQGYTEKESRYLMWRWQWRRRIAIAQGIYPAHLILKGGRVLNVFTGDLIDSDVAIDAGRIAAIGQFGDAEKYLDVSGCIVAPSFIDPSFDLASTLGWPPEIARVIVPRGTGTIITDPHPFANVSGVRGVEALRNAVATLPIDIRFSIPLLTSMQGAGSPGHSCRPRAIEEMLSWPEAVAFGGDIDTQSVLQAGVDVAAGIWEARDLPRHGDTSSLSSESELQAHVSAGFDTDLQAHSLLEAQAKLRAGMFVALRLSRGGGNVHELLRLINDATWPRITFAPVDRRWNDPFIHGHMDDILRIAIEGGIDPIRAITMATWNPARHWKLDGIGAVTPGYRANLVVLSDLSTVEVKQTIHNGRIVAADGQLLDDLPIQEAPVELRHTIHLAPVRLSDLRDMDVNRNRVIDAQSGQIFSQDEECLRGDSVHGVESVVERDLAKLASVDRHRATGRIRMELVYGFGLTRGAMASSVTHDAHHLVAIGVNDADMLAAIATIAESGGGLAVVADQQVLAHLPLPIAGLVADVPLEDVAQSVKALEDAARSLGCQLQNPFDQLKFLSLSLAQEIFDTE